MDRRLGLIVRNRNGGGRRRTKKARSSGPRVNGGPVQLYLCCEPNVRQLEPTGRLAAAGGGAAAGGV